MKKWAAVVVAAALTYSGQALSESHEMCSIESQTAEVIMELRQEGVPMRELVDKAKEQGFYDATTKVMIRMAYDRPAAQSESYKEKQKAEFGNASTETASTNNPVHR